MDDLDCSAEQKLKGAVSLLQDEAYQWWITGKYVGGSCVAAHRKESLNLAQGNKTVAEYEVELLRLSRYASGIVATEYECSVQFEDGLRNELKVLIAPQRDRDFATLVVKAKIVEEEHKFRECPRRVAQDQVAEQRGVQPLRGGPPPQRGRGQGKGGNGNG
ncbi:uncharacterized protein [Gossypium hirsutum]|uniref:Uncharacterized protein n=1 Tax=Gossypium hirsutum TaxID=3635 RepID=A0A1U8P9Z2_GOSHI|nr:uncharacterized protein LOC107955784 [Gossypium hirsutum]